MQAIDYKDDSGASANDIAQSMIEYLKICVAMRREVNNAAGRENPPGWCYTGMEDFLLKHGRFWTPRQLPDHVPRMTPNQCFDNAFKLASRRKNLRYCEGIAYSVLPLHHAWVIEAFEQSAVAVVRATTKQIRSHMAVSTQHNDVIAFRLGDQSPVKVGLIIPSDQSECFSVRPTVTIFVMESQKLESLFRAAPTLSTVNLNCFASCFAPFFGGVFPVPFPPAVAVPSSKLRGLCGAIFSTDATVGKTINCDSLSASSAEYVVGHGSTIHNTGASVNEWRVPELLDNNVIDPTWASTGCDVGEAYFGVTFPVTLVREHRSSRCTSVLNNWINDFRLYKSLFNHV